MCWQKGWVCNKTLIDLEFSQLKLYLSVAKQVTFPVQVVVTNFPSYNVILILPVEKNYPYSLLKTRYVQISMEV